ncbi:hypothetical protein HBA47_02160 [Kingella kingae]|uniref:hypothetical protein n=1 Tax=Kingella kingae TaxID=504 RepID=UPI0012B681EC|nr:hypothetical protein [Kingella kingae]QIP46879.1 hypothetical protein HBA47_02160 [Kingella kingae]
MGLTVEISKRIQDISWHILPKRWIVERTFAWLGWSRRLADEEKEDFLYDLEIILDNQLLEIVK